MAWLFGTAAVVQGLTAIGLGAVAGALHTATSDIFPIAHALRPLFVVAGWGVGLYASGFPRLVERRRAREVIMQPTVPRPIEAADVSELAP
jgi:hypothetical protein